MKLILLTSRYYGREEIPENINEGVFSSVDSAINAISAIHKSSQVKHTDNKDGTGKIEVSQPHLGSAFDYTYDYSTVELDRII